MTLDTIAVTVLLSLSTLLGVPSVPAQLEGWHVQKEWTRKAGIFTFEATSSRVIIECKANPSKVVSFPSIIHATHKVQLDGEVTEKFGDETFRRARSFYGSPAIPCEKILNARLLTWTVNTQSQYFSRLPRFPRLTVYGNLQNVLSEVTSVMGAGASLLFVVLIFMLFWGKVPQPLALSLIGSVTFMALFCLFSVTGFFSLPVSMLMAHRMADLSIWIGMGFLCSALSFQKLLNKKVGIGILWVILVSAINIVVAKNEDGVQFGTTLPMLFVLPALTMAGYRSLIGLLTKSIGFREVLESISLVIFIGILFHDVMFVVGLTEGPALFSVGLIFGLCFLLVALNEHVISVFRERDHLKLQEFRLVKDAEYSHLARQVSHDIRSPLAALSTAICEIPGHGEVLEVARMAVDRIRAIADDLLEKGRSQFERNDSHVGISKVFIPQILEEIATEKRLQLKFSHRVEINLFVQSPRNTLFSLCHPTQFGRVVSNLINNAEESIEGSGKIEVYLSSTNDHVLIRIVDSGNGISEEILPKLMERGATFQKLGGNGLGLFHARERIQAWGGSIKIYSEIGRGTSVTITLPRVHLRGGCPNFR